MSNRDYQLEKIKNYDDEIDLMEILKSIIRERKLIMIITLFSFLLSVGVGLYRKKLPQSYSSNIIFIDNSMDFLLSENFLFDTFDKFDTFDTKDNNLAYHKISLLVNKNKIVDFIISNGLKENQEKSIEDLNEKNFLLKFLLNGIAKEENIQLLEEKIQSNIEILNEKINELSEENLKATLLEKENFFKELTKESNAINKKINRYILKNKIKSYENISERISLIEPVLYMEFKENQNQLKNCYSDIQALNYLLKTNENKNIFLLKLEDINLNKNWGFNLIVFIGTLFGLFMGIGIAIIKAPLKQFFEELKNEKLFN